MPTPSACLSTVSSSSSSSCRTSAVNCSPVDDDAITGISGDDCCSLLSPPARGAEATSLRGTFSAVVEVVAAVVVVVVVVEVVVELVLVVVSNMPVDTAFARASSTAIL